MVTKTCRCIRRYVKLFHVLKVDTNWISNTANLTQFRSKGMIDVRNIEYSTKEETYGHNDPVHQVHLGGFLPCRVENKDD